MKLGEDTYHIAPPEPFKTQVLVALLLEYTVWCDDDHLRIRPKYELCGEPHSISWAQAARLAGVVVNKPVGRDCNDYTRSQKSA